MMVLSIGRHTAFFWYVWVHEMTFESFKYPPAVMGGARDGCSARYLVAGWAVASRAFASEVHLRPRRWHVVGLRDGFHGLREIPLISFAPVRLPGNVRETVEDAQAEFRFGDVADQLILVGQDRLNIPD
jgi:hypothetical protein